MYVYIESLSLKLYQVIVFDRKTSVSLTKSPSGRLSYLVTEDGSHAGDVFNKKVVSRGGSFETLSRKGIHDLSPHTPVSGFVCLLL